MLRATRREGGTKEGKKYLRGFGQKEEVLDGESRKKPTASFFSIKERGNR